MKTFKLISTHGTITANAADGTVVSTNLYKYWPGQLPVGINIAEWHASYPDTELCGEHDILDFGYWTGPELDYTQPCFSWRRDREALRRQEAEDLWETFPDERVRTIWGCSRCAATAKATLRCISDGGIPFCTECAKEMYYRRTEIKQKENEEIEENKKPAEDPEFIEGPVSRATSEVSEVPRWLI